MAVLVYTLLRAALFGVIWVLFEFLTPIHGLWAAVSALLISGAISVVVLDRPRNKVGLAAGGFFGRINERIDASARAEDDDEDAAVASDDGEQKSQHDSIAEQ
jgi:hypothetical protein